MPRVWVPIGPWAPDAPDYDTEVLEDAKNLLPFGGNYRSLSQFAVQAEQESAYPVTGCHAHMITDRQARQRGYPLGDGSEEVGSDWENYGDVPEGEDDNAANRINELTVDDTNGIEIRGESTYSDRIAKFNLNALQVTPFDTDHFLRFRYRIFEPENFTAYTIQVTVVNGSDNSPVTLQTITEADPLDEDSFQTFEYELSGAEVATILDYAQLEIWFQFQGTAVASPIFDVKAREVYAGSGDWVTAGGAESLLDGILEADDKRINSTTQDEDRLLEVAMEPIYEPASQGDANTWKGIVRMRCHDTEGDNGASVELVLFNGLNEVKRTTVSVPQSATYTDYEISVDNTELVDWGPDSDLQWEDVNWNDWRVAIEASSDGAAGGAVVVHDAQSLQFEESGGWTSVNGTKLTAVTSAKSKSSYIESVAGQPTKNSRIVYQFPPGMTFDIADTVRVVCQVGFFGASGEAKVSFAQGGVDRQSKNFIGNKTQNDIDIGFTLNENTKQTVIDSGFVDVDIKLEHRNRYNDPLFYLRYFWIFLEIDGSGGTYRVVVDRVSMAAPSQLGIQVSHTQFLVPSLASEAPGDRVILYAGTQDRLYEVSAAGFIDRSKAGGYGAGNNQGPWRFVSWGPAVIATNGSDPVQYQPEYGVPFEDLFTSDDKPTARHLAVVKDFAKFSNILITGEEADFNELVAWWSEYNNPRSVKRVDLETQSDFQPLYSRAGEITCHRGGEASTLFKRNSIYRQSYVGPPFIFDNDLVADQEGTAFPESVVQVERDLFFFGNGGFRLLPWGGVPQPIGDGAVTRTFIDTVMEDRALELVQSEDRRELENAVVGTYDPWTRLIIWLYRLKGGTAYRNTVGVCYAPFEDRWAPLDLDTRFGYSQILASPNIQSQHRALTRNIHGFSWDGSKVYWERMVSPTSYRARLASKILSAAFFGGTRGDHMTVHKIRLVMTRDDSDEVLSQFRLPTGRRYIVMAEDPWFSEGVTSAEILDAQDAANDDGWLVVGDPVSGAFMRVVFEFDPVTDGTIREFIGYEMEVSMAGTR